MPVLVKRERRGVQQFRADKMNILIVVGARPNFMKAAPTAMVGFGNLVPPTRHFTFDVEFGAVFQGSVRTKLNLAGGACPSGFCS